MEPGKDNCFSVPEHTALLDRELLDKTLGGHTSLIIKSMEMFFKTAQDLMDGMRAAIAADNNGDLETNAHSLKGIVGYFNQGVVHRLCAELQFSGRDGSLPGDHARVEREFQRLEALIRDLCEEMKEEMVRLA
ncbi:Hpt domain-containing protein [Phaeovibrio sulfidiphilus]|uniref:Hpt domain-containing protein n=1 Tax=Phaeovibrio sulfidiphilus TaxID=1220600 RepID=A0A8J6YLL0_9PROT|nr:Hpt domain-containing protein [Phaeovibrio sulfidiphilus]MBE1237015.1 Hpt domain-containing protein [Phaeovibrio sulfidiphilus]